MNTHAMEPLWQLHIWQQNTNQSLEAQLDLLNSLNPAHHSIVAIQDPHIGFLGNPRATSHWYTIYPPKHRDDLKWTQSLILISKCLISTNKWTQIPIDSPDITTIRIDINCSTILIYNIYNDGTHPRNLNCLDEHLHVLRTDSVEAHGVRIIWLGNFNRHHPLWEEDRNVHLFDSTNLNASQPLLNLLTKYNMCMALPKGIPTLEALNTKNYTRPDNVFCSSELLGSFISCNTNPSSRPPQTHHLPILSELNTELHPSILNPRPNFRATNWGKFTDHLSNLLEALPMTHITTAQVLNEAVDALT